MLSMAYKIHVYRRIYLILMLYKNWDNGFSPLETLDIIKMAVR